MRGKLLASVLATGVVLGGAGAAWAVDQTGTGTHDAAAHASDTWSGSIARFGESAGDSDGRLIITYDPQTGQRNGRYTSSFSNEADPTLALGISPDRKWAAATTSRGLAIAQRSGTAFKTVRTITTDDLESQDRDASFLGSPHFIDNGHLKFAAEQSDDTGTGPLGGYQLDLSDPSGAPVRTDGSDYWDSHGHPVENTGALPIEGLPTIDGYQVTADVAWSSDELAYASIKDDRVENMFYPYYRCNQRLDADSLLCMADLATAARRGYTPPRGTVAILRRSADGKSATLTKLVGTLPAHSQPASPETLEEVYLSPDKKTILMVTKAGWYSANVDGSNVQYRYPHLGAVPVGGNEFLDGWGPGHYTPYYAGAN